MVDKNDESDIMSLINGEQKGVWSRLLGKEKIVSGLEKCDDGVYLRVGRMMLRFSSSPIPGLCGLVDLLGKRVWVDAYYNWLLESARASFSY